jgi:transcriptional regulator NrdR family protein
MICPNCDGNLRNVRTYQEGDGAYEKGYITRLKRCVRCGKRYITKQQPEVVKSTIKSS